MSEKEIRAALEKVHADLELKTRKGLLHPGVRAALVPVAIGATIGAIACSAEPLLADGGELQSTTSSGGAGGTGTLTGTATGTLTGTATGTVQVGGAPPCTDCNTAGAGHGGAPGEGGAAGAGGEIGGAGGAGGAIGGAGGA